jgi:hypothetical protein
MKMAILGGNGYPWRRRQWLSSAATASLGGQSQSSMNSEKNMNSSDSLTLMSLTLESAFFKHHTS